MRTLDNTGFSYPVMVLTHSSGNNLGNSHFIWKVLSTDSIEQGLLKSAIVIDTVKLEIPQYHTRAMRQAMAIKFGRISPGINLQSFVISTRNLLEIVLHQLLLMNR